MNDESVHGPWICHVCDYTSRTSDSQACAVCYKTTCSAHLKTVPTFNPDSRLFELLPVCVVCSLTR